MSDVIQLPKAKSPCSCVEIEKYLFIKHLNPNIYSLSVFIIIFSFNFCKTCNSVIKKTTLHFY